MLAGKRRERTTTGALDRMIEASKQEQTGTQTAPRSVAAMRKSEEYRPLKTAEETVRTTTEDTSRSGEKADTPTLGGRLKRMASGAGKQYVSGYANLAGLGQTGTTKRMRSEAAEELDNLEREIAVQKTLLDDPNASEADRESAQSMIEGMEKKADAYRRAYGTGGENEKTAAKLYKTADDLAERGAQDVQEAKRGLGKVGSLAVDAGVGGMQLGADILLGLPTGGAMVPMALRSAGGASQEARQEGASHEQQAGYGMAAGAISVLTEGLSNAAKPLAKVFGKGIADDMVDQAVKSLAARLAKTPTGRAAAQVLLKTGVSALGEGFEEMAEDAFDVAAKRMIYDPTAELDVGEMLYDGLVGGTLGGVLGLGGEIVGARGEYEKYRLKTAEELAAQKKAAPTAESGVQTETTPKYLKTVEEMAAERNAAAEETAVTVESGPTALTERNRENNTLAYTLATNVGSLESMQPVTKLRGTELNDRTVKPDQQIRNFFRTIGGKIFRSGFGDVSLGEYGVGGVLNHRPLNRAKMLSLAAVPDVIQSGRQISYTENWKERGYKSYIFAAPVVVGKDTVYVAAVVDQRPDNKFYLSEMVDSNGNYVRINESPSGSSKSGVTDGAENIDGAGVTARPEGLSEGNAPSTSQNEVKPAFPFVDTTVPQDTAGVNAQDMQGDAEYAQEGPRYLKTAEEMAAERAAAEEASYRQAEQTAKDDEIGEMLDDLRRQAPQGPEKPSTVRGTGAMDTLDIRIEGDQGDYGRSAALRGAEEAKRQTIRARRKAEEQMSPTAAEKTFAKGVADGTYQENDIPASMNREKVLALADYYYAESTFKGIGGVQERATEIRARNETLAKEVFEKAEKSYRPMNMLKMNLNTPERVMRRSFGETIGEEINSTYFYPTQKNEAEKVRWINRMLDEVRTFKGRNGTESELTQAERAFVQQIMEDRAVGETVASMELRGSIESAAENIRGGAEAKDAAREFGLDRKERELAERLARWRTNEELLASGEWDSMKIENAVEKFSKQYDLFYDAINDFLTAHGFAPIGFIKGYAPHMQKAETQNKISSALKAMGVNIDVTELPTSISGRTADYKPGKRWVGNFLHRKGSSTDYDISAGYESYVGKIADVFYHTDDIARLRGLERYLRKTYAPEEISNAIDHAQSLRNVDNATKRAALEDAGVVDGGTELSAVKMSEELEKYIGSLYDDASKITKYGEFVKYIDNYANLLAGKQSMADRGLEYIAGRTSLNAGNKLVSMFARAQVAGNLSSVLNQSSQLKDIAAEIPAKHITKAIGDICRGTGGKPWNVKNTEMFNSYDLLTGKKGIEYLTAKDNKANAFVTGLFKPADIADSLVSALAVQSRYNQLISEGKSEADAKTGADRWATSIMASRMKGSRPMIFESKNVVTQMISMFQVEAANSWAHLTQDLPAKVKSIETQYGKGAAQKYVAVTATKGLLSAFLMNRIAEAAYGGTPASFDLLGYAARFISSGMGITVNEGLKRIFEDMAETVFGENIFGGDDEDDEDDEDKNRTFDFDAAVSDAAYDISNDIPFVRGVSGALGLGDQTLPLANVAEAVGGVKNALTAEDRSAGQIADAALELGSTLVPGGRQLQKTYQGAKTMLQGGRTYGYGDKKRLQYTVEQTPLKAFQALAFGNSGLSETRDFYAGDAKGLSVRQTQAVEELHSIGVDRTEAYGIIRKMRGAEKQADKARIVAASDLTDEQMIRLYGSISSEKEAENIAAAYSADISPAVYIGLKTKAGAMEADRDADGEVINGSKREKVLKLIDSMELSDYQKDVLYLTEGYSEKTIDDAPWNQSEYEKYRLKLPKYELPEYELKVKPLPRP
jgi:hypothetical protein